MLVSIRKGIQLLKFLPVLLLYVDNGWGGTPQSTPQALSVLAYIRKKALKPGRKTECTRA